MSTIHVTRCYRPVTSAPCTPFYGPLFLARVRVPGRTYRRAYAPILPAYGPTYASGHPHGSDPRTVGSDQDALHQNVTHVYVPIYLSGNSGSTVTAPRREQRHPTIRTSHVRVTN